MLRRTLAILVFVASSALAAASSTTTLNISPNPATINTQLTLNATITAGATGTVSFAIAPPNYFQLTDPVPVINGRATITIPNSGSLIVGGMSYSALYVGDTPIVAIYSGDKNFNGSTSAPVTLTMLPATGIITLTAPASIGTYFEGDNFYLEAVTSTQPPTNLCACGTVEFLEGNVVVATSPVVIFKDSDKAFGSLSGVQAGAHTFSARYKGAVDFFGHTVVTPAVSASVTAVVKRRANPTVSVSPKTPVYTQPITLTATVPAAATGIVDFGDAQGHDLAKNVAVSGGKAQVTVNSTMWAGIRQIYARYGGDSM
ncbi:MAG TPA: Ig-like domain-containing protein, partial [Candidatus Solibacter sp.]|nr:Ig-like domain-containing protein [Candidatus Solibacter sp.]